MALLKRKEAATPSPAGTRRTLADFPEWAAALETQRRLNAAHDTIVANYRHADSVTHEATPQEGRIKNLTTSLLEKVGVRPAQPAKASEEAEGADLAEKRAACETAIAQHERKLRTLRSELQAEIYSQWEQEHFAARQRIARAVVELAQAVQDEQELANRMSAAGAISGPHFGGRLWVNCSNSPLIPRVFRSLDIRAFIECNRNLLD